MLELFIVAIVLIGIAIAGIAIKMLFKPNETFKKVCGSQFDPKTGKPMACSCGSQSKEECENVKLEIKLNEELTV
jgi:hypothetical protein